MLSEKKLSSRTKDGKINQDYYRFKCLKLLEEHQQIEQEAFEKQIHNMILTDEESFDVFNPETELLID